MDQDFSRATPAEPKATQRTNSAECTAVALVAAWVTISNQRLVLVTQRAAGTHLGGFLELPGGKIELGESPAAAARRELAEETGLEIRSPDPLIVIHHAYPDRNVRLHAFTAEVAAADMELVRCDGQHRLVSMSELSAVAFPPANRAITAAIVARLSGEVHK